MKILILDASELSRDRTEKLLCSMGVLCSDIYTFDNGEDALEFIDDYSVDLLFSSLELSKMDGVSFADIFLHKFPNMVSRLFITSSSQGGESFQEVKEVGAKRFIKKPIDEKYFQHFISKEIDKIRIKNKVKV
ncbi:response regulator [Sulfurimonas aquatica]|uniref:Response regulator n=1 Tax=Sulfurimonas aquatica TaxID=2672570 RepID=A0A975GCC9_9BACT|nr:response regulator [Sulfurimonas aquatica]QSZ41586.1 response regulator [Sulfurimonas aquatica]